uniref:Receptor expression-enhancing protein 6 n=1 Tax=Pseudonaja textilis TaxID=8673 RepID=A0A670ZJU9_PSETE
MFSVVEFFSDTFLYWFPFYYAGKVYGEGREDEAGGRSPPDALWASISRDSSFRGSLSEGARFDGQRWASGLNAGGRLGAPGGSSLEIPFLPGWILTPPTLLCCHPPSPQCFFLLWCMAPFSWNGSQVLYRSLIRPWFLKHHRTVDSVLSDLTGRAASVASAASREGVLPRSLQAED